MTSQSPARAHHETRDVSVRGVFMFGLGLFTAVLAIELTVWALFLHFDSEVARGLPTYPVAAHQAPRLPPEPRLQTNPRDDLRALRQHEDEVLRRYAWIDKRAGIVRIPIEEAMKLTLERGLPARGRQEPAR